LLNWFILIAALIKNGVDCAKVGVLKEADQVAGLLQSHDGRALEAKVGLVVLRDLTHQPLKGQFADEQLGALLAAMDLAECQRPGIRSLTMRAS